MQRICSTVLRMPTLCRMFNVPAPVQPANERIDLLNIIKKEISSHNEVELNPAKDQTINLLKKNGFKEIPSKSKLSVCFEKSVNDKLLMVYSDTNMVMTKPTDAPEEEGKEAKPKTEDEEGAMETMVAYIATLSKQNSNEGIIAEVFATEEGIEIGSVKYADNISVHKKAILENGKVPEMIYGPSFERLDERLQTGLHDYLGSLGLNEELVQNMYDLLNKKEEGAYGEWLHKVSEFIA